MDRFVNHYESQVGGGYSPGIDHVYIGSSHQRGHRIGSFPGGLWRQALPLLRSGARTLGKEALSAGAHVISDVVDHDAPLLASFRNRSREAKKNLKRKALNKITTMMSGSGYKSSRSRVNTQLRAALRAKRTTAAVRKKKKAARTPVKRVANKKRKLEDIFT